MPAAADNAVQIVINVVDGNTGAVVSNVVKSLDQMGEAGVRTGKKMADGLKVASDAGANTARQVRQTGAEMQQSASTSATASSSVVKSLDQMGEAGARAGKKMADGLRIAAEAAPAAAKQVRQASAEMQQMLDNIGRTQAKLATVRPPRQSSPLGESFANLGTARGEMDALGNSFAQLGNKASAGGGEAAKGVKKIGDHALTSLDNVRLLRDDLGIRIPRSMEKAIASSKVLSSAIGAIGGGLLFFGAAEIFIHIGEEIYNVYKRLTDVNAEMRKFAQESGRSANQELFNNSSLETTVALLGQVQQQKAALEKQRSEAGVGLDNSGSLIQYAGRAFAGFAAGATGDAKVFQQARGVFGPEADQRLASVSADEEVLKKRQDVQERQRRVQEKQDALTHAADGIEGRAATAAKRRAQHDLNEAQRQAVQAGELYEVATTKRARALEDAQNKVPVEQRTQVHQVSKDAGLYDQQRADRNSDLEAGAANARQSRTEGNEARHAAAEARIAGLEGEPFHLAQEQEELRLLSERAAQIGIAGDAYNTLRAAIETKFIEARKKRIRDENAQTAQLDAEAGLGGLKGLAELDQKRVVELAALAKESKTFADPTTLSKRTADINKRSTADGARLQESFTDKLTQLDAGRADRYASESDRITLSANKTVAEIRKAWEDLYGQLTPLDARRVQSQQALNDEIAKINADTARQRQEAGQRIEDETRKIEDQARRSGLPKYQQETAAIVDDYNERFQKLEELRAKDSANADRYRRQELAEEQLKNGKLLEQRRALEEQLAGKLRGLFSNPLEALKQQGEEQAAKAASQLLFRFAPNVSTAVAGGLGKGGGGIFDKGGPNILGVGFGGKHPAVFDHGASQAGSGTHNANPQPSTDARPQLSTGSTTLTASSATITIGSATISGSVSVASSGKAGSASGPAAGATTSPSVGTSSAPSFDAGAASGSLGAGVEAAVSATQTGGASSSSSVSSDAGSSSAASAIETGASTASTAASAFDKLSKGGLKSWASKIPGFSKIGSNVGGLLGGGLGLFSAIDGKGGFGGAFSGASSAAKLGSIFGGPLGAGAGALIGGALGFIGFGSRGKAAAYDRKEVKPRIANGLLAFEAGQGDYTSTYADLESLTLEAKRQTRQMGRGAVGYYNDTILPEIKTAEQRLTREQKAGRSKFGFSAAQFHGGGLIRDFGSMATTDGQGWIHAERGEIMLNQQAAMTHADAAMMMNAGVSRSDTAAYYGGGSSTRAADTGSGGDVHLHVHAIDTRGVKQFLSDNKHGIRAALNASYAENSGGGDE